MTPSKPERLASSLDLLPTLLAAAGINAPAGLPGLNLLDNKAVKSRKTLYGASFTHDLMEMRNPAAKKEVLRTTPLVNISGAPLTTTAPP